LPGLLPGLSMTSQPGSSNFATASQTARASQTPHEVVRAERRLKRQRIERDLQARLEQQKNHSDSAEKTGGVLDVGAVLEKALVRENHVTGVKSTINGAASQASSFDENDYYSSQVESEWSSPGGKDADRAGAVSAFANARRLEGNTPSSRLNVVGVADKTIASQYPVIPHSQAGPSVYITKPPNHEESDIDDDDEYSPPDVAGASDDSRDEQFDSEMLHDDADDSSEYEPGEITSESNGGTPVRPRQVDGPASPQVPVIRNHLTHIAAPQPSRVSPLTVTKGPAAGELQLINGRPEFVSAAPMNQVHQARGRSPDDANGGGSKKGKNKKGKRKRDAAEREVEVPTETKLTKKQKRQELAKAEKSRRLGKASEPSHISTTRQQRQAHQQPQPQQQPQQPLVQPPIKDEPTSPASFLHNVPAAQSGSIQSQPVYIDLASPRRAADEERYYQVEAPRHAPAAQPKQYRLSSPAHVGPASRVAYRPLHRDSHDLRRVASLQHAQRPLSPVARYDPAEASGSPLYQPLRTREARSHSPTFASDAYDPQQYTRVAEPLPMAPPPPRRIFVDQHGNHYYAEPAQPSRASVAPVDRRSYVEERAPSRVSMAYAPPASARPQYERVEASMAPPPFPGRAASIAVDRPQYAESPEGHYSSREQSVRPVVREIRYVEAPTASSYQQQAPLYDTHARATYEATHARPASPSDMHPARSYSVRPAPIPMPRSGSVAPVQYIRQEGALPATSYTSRQSMAPPPPQQYAPPRRPMSIAPGYDIPPPAPSRPMSVAPSPYAPSISHVQAPQQYLQPQYRATSVAPGGYDPHTAYATQPPQQPPQQYYSVPSRAPAAPAPQQIRYVDQNGQEVFPREVSQYEDYRAHASPRY
jgi:hypothetical protein